MILLGSKSETAYLEVNAKEVNGAESTKFVSVDLELHRIKDGTLYWTFKVIGEEDSPDTTLFIDK